MTAETREAKYEASLLKVKKREPVRRESLRDGRCRRRRNYTIIIKMKKTVKNELILVVLSMGAEMRERYAIQA